MSTVTVRAERPGDAAAVDATIRAAFCDEGDQVAAIWAELGPLGHLQASLVTEVDGEVVGHVGLSRAWVDARRALVEVAVLSPLSVRPDRQGDGLGTRLVAAAIEEARGSGTPLLFLEGSPAYYGPRGFAAASPLGFRPPSVRTPDRAFQVVVFDAWEDWMTGRLVYPDVWWRYDGAGLRDPDLAALEEVLGVSR